MGVPITRTIFTPPAPERGVWGRSWRISFSAPSEASLINVAIKAREEQINLFFRAVATKRSEVNLKGGLEGLSIWSRTLPRNAQKKAIIFRLSLCVERKTRVCPYAPHSVYQAIAFAQYYTPNSRDTWVVSRCRFRVRLLPYKLQNYSCLRQIYD